MPLWLSIWMLLNLLLFFKFIYLINIVSYVPICGGQVQKRRWSERLLSSWSQSHENDAACAWLAALQISCQGDHSTKEQAAPWWGHWGVGEVHKLGLHFECQKAPQMVTWVREALAWSGILLGPRRCEQNLMTDEEKRKNKRRKDPQVGKQESGCQEKRFLMRFVYSLHNSPGHCPDVPMKR